VSCVALRCLAVAFSACSLTSCGPTIKSYALTQSYNEIDFKPFAGPGPSSLSGQGFLKTVGGDVKTCAGNKVYLVPSTAYNDEVIEHSHRNESVSNRDPQSSQFTRQVICDATGTFSFAQVPALRWYVVTTVTWGVPNKYGVDKQGGDLVQQVNLMRGANQVILTDANLY